MKGKQKQVLREKRRKKEGRSDEEGTVAKTRHEGVLEEDKDTNRN